MCLTTDLGGYRCEKGLSEVIWLNTFIGQFRKLRFREEK
jgi:hypothetical protein